MATIRKDAVRRGRARPGDVEIGKMLVAQTLEDDHTIVPLDGVLNIKKNVAGDELVLDLPAGGYTIFSRLACGASEPGWAGCDLWNEVFDITSGEEVLADLPGYTAGTINPDARMYVNGDATAIQDRVVTRFGGDLLTVPRGKTYRVKLGLYVWGTWFGDVGGGPLVPLGVRANAAANTYEAAIRATALYQP